MALLVLLTLAFYREIALTGKILPGVDAFTYFYPYRQVAAQAVCSGRVPLWNPYLFMGVPFLANAQTAVFYPLNAALCFLDGPRLVTWSIVIHVALAGVFSYLYARRSLRLSVPPALIAASAFAFGGFLSGMVEHVNQLNVSAWFPLLLLLWDAKSHNTRFLGKIGYLIGISLIVALGLLAGHTQSTYICLVGLGVYAMAPVLWPTKGLPVKAYFKTLGQTALALALIALLGVLLAAVQLVPTLELSRLSIRGGGLSYREAIAFSLKPLPRLLRYTLLPPLGANLADQFGGDFFTEYIAYMGVVPLVLVIGWLGIWVVGWLGGSRTSGRGFISSAWAAIQENAARPAFKLLVLAGLGLFLALGGYNPLYWVLYKLAPGFGLFRVPARWLFLYAFGAATLAGVGLERILPSQSPPQAGGKPRSGRGGLRVGVLVVALAELFWAAQSLPLAHPTAPEAFSSLRTAPAHILAAQSLEPMPGRVLSMSDILFDPGDQGEMAQVFAGQLNDKAIYDYVVSAKRKEILAPNLPLAWEVYAVDGYDGGVLPLQRYVDLQRLLLPADQVSPDGRLRENLKRVPPARLLSLLGVRYVITDKVNDVWIEDVFYDLAFEAVLGQEGTTSISTVDLPAFAANALGIVAWVEGTIGENAQVAEIRLDTEDGELVLPLYRKQVGENVDARQAARVQWAKPSTLRRLEVIAQSGTLHIQGVTLIDERDGSNVPVLLSTDGQYRLVHSGDVKVYEVLDALPRAFVVKESYQIGDDEQAIAKMQEASFDPARMAIVSSWTLDWTIDPRNKASLTHSVSGIDASESTVDVLIYEPEHIKLNVTIVPDAETGQNYNFKVTELVLTDTWYPGWQVTVDGKPSKILKANANFRAVSLSPGTHTVEFTYKPSSYTVGLGISLATLCGIILALVAGLAVRRLGKKRLTMNGGIQ